MPPRRQLPWAHKGGSSKNQVKQAQSKRSSPSDAHDDFFDGTVLESPRKERGDAQTADDRSTATSSKLIGIRERNKESSRDARMPSSSPPLIAADLPPPPTEYMFTGVDKFDLQDDEWMMVEDELLQTAKLFTRHLHLAEYEKLKRKIDDRRKVSAVRPVVAGAKPSVEGQFKRKADEQARNQKKAIRELLSSRDDDTEDDVELPPRTVPHKANSLYSPTRPPNTTKPPSTARPLPTSKSMSNESAYDSDDLDVIQRPTVVRQSRPPSTASGTRTTMSKSPANTTQAKESDIVRKPTTYSQARPKPARAQRRNLWDEWDELMSNPTPSTTQSSTSKAPHGAPSPRKSIGSSATKGPSFFAGTSAPKIALQKTEAEQDDEKKSKYDDIPTFLY